MSASDVDFPSDLRSLESEYELIREIGHGGMAAVYLARHRTTGALVAIKAIRARYLDDPDAIKRFAREASTVAGLDHPNIVRTEAIRQIDDRAVAIIMEHIPGGTVRDRLREYGSLGAEDAESILRDVANALGYAHRHGIVHRDVKPENIFLDPSRRRALLSDFGIARNIDSESGITLLGAALGTPQYMSPEQIDGNKVDGRSDIYSLGVLGWELLTGKRPWAGESLYGVIYKQKHEELPRITAMRPRVPANLLFAIEGALVKDRERRWQSMDEFLTQLTYNPPPVLAGAFPPGLKGDYEPTVEFRPVRAEEDVAIAEESPSTFANATAANVTAANVVDVVERDAHAEERTLVAPAAAVSNDDMVSAVTIAALADPSDGLNEPVYSGPEYILPDFDPNAAASFELPTHRKRTLQVLGLLVPLGVAAASLLVLLSGSASRSTQQGRPNRITASAGSVIGDSGVPPNAPTTPSAADTDHGSAIVLEHTIPEAAPAAGVVAGSSTVAARPSATIPEPAPRKPVASSTRVRPTPTMPATSAPGSSARGDSNRAVAAVRPPGDSGNPSARADSNGSTRSSAESIEDPFKIPPSEGNVAPLGPGAVPSPRCRLAANVDQQVCLSAYVAIGDAPLNRAFESLVDELRRVAHTPLGAPDPPTVQRIRVEQRAWIAIRDSECPRKAPIGAGPFWAEAQAGCFSEMAVARAAELRDAVKRLKKS